MRLDDWFLTSEERGNSFSDVDAIHSSRIAWTEGNDVAFLIDGEEYFSRLVSAFSDLQRGDEVRFTDWRTDADECLVDGGPTISEMVSDSCRRGIDVRGLLWRSHSDRFAFSAKQNRRFATVVTSAGGQVLLDERVRRGGSHHQKMVLIRHPSSLERDVAFVGGIDFSHGRRDNARHHGNDQIITLDPRYGPKPAWHDAQLELRGPAIGDLDQSFRERWEDPTPLNHAGVARAWFSRALSRDRVAGRLPVTLATPPPQGTLAVQVLRTYPSRRPRYRFAPSGERSVARAFAKAIDRARALIYIEDQYFWSVEIAEILARALKRRRDLQLIVVVPRFPDKDGHLSGPPSRLAQSRAMQVVRAAGGERVGFFNVQNETGTPIYVHAKVCVIDDVWVTVGSDNLNRRSWTHDSELSCAVIDSERDARVPLDPGGLGDGSRRFARDLRLTLWAEHLGRLPDDPALLESDGATALWTSCARELENWSSGTLEGPRPTSRIRAHVVDPVPRSARWWATIVYRLVFDPDGRPLRLRLRNRF